MIRENKQRIVDSKKGDCFPAAMTSMLGIPYTMDIPVDETWYQWWHQFLWEYGLTLRFSQKSCWSEGYWVASVRSLNYPGVATHAIVMNGSKVAFDPSTRKRYRVGTSLLGKDVVLGGHSLTVIDPSKLYKLRVLQLMP